MRRASPLAAEFIFISIETVVWKDGYTKENELRILVWLIRYFGVLFSVLCGFMV